MLPSVDAYPLCVLFHTKVPVALVDETRTAWPVPLEVKSHASMQVRSLTKTAEVPVALVNVQLS